ncbi:MAG: DMT family transporter [Candidatus Marinimicrobia bacterium]|nr:DMT family transporter [Candidatus Neomarinimicrobiota bacterium]MDA1364019.1 DMT family transporter [Candidatus Neomarinimicrobiota bacterium]
MKAKNYYQLLTTSVLWGSSFILIKFSLKELDPYQIAFFRTFIGMLFINLLYKNKVKFSFKSHLRLTIIGIIWMTLPFYFFAKAEETIDASLAGLINGSTPIFVSLIAVIFFKQRISNLQKIYLFTGFIGIYLVSFGYTILNFEINVGTMLSITASICYAIALNIIQPLLGEYASMDVLKVALRYGAFFSFLLFIFNSNFVFPKLPSTLLSILILGIGSSGVAFMTFYKLINDVGTIIGSITVYIIPVFASIFGFIFFQEVTSLVQIFGILVIVYSAFKFSRT